MNEIIESLREVGGSHIASGDHAQQLIGEALLQVADKAEAKKAKAEHTARRRQRHQRDRGWLRSIFPTTFNDTP